MFSLYFVIPAASTRLLVMDAGKVLTQLTSAHKADFRESTRPPFSPPERLLAAAAPMSVLPSLITSLLAAFPHPFQYLMLHASVGP